MCVAFLQTYKQKIKHLLFEHQHNMAAVKADAEQAVQAARQGVVKQQDDAAHDVRTLHTMLREQVIDTCPPHTSSFEMHM